jgi:LCP family protein required for cell wall assembly
VLARGLIVAAGIASISALVLAGWLWTTVEAIAPRTQLEDILALIGSHPGQSLVARKTAAGERINVLLLGYGGPGQRGPYLTDSITVLSIDPEGRQAVVISLPRDLWVQVPALAPDQSVWARLNAAYAMGADRTDFPAVRDRWKGPTGGGDLAAATVEQVTGLSIDYWISVDFGAFRGVVDALGGIIVNAPSPLDDPCFPAHFPAGSQWLNGQRALIYARSRMTTSDFDRSRRQRLILMAIDQRLRSENLLPRLLPLIGALRGNLLTNLRPVELRDLAHVVAGLNQADIRQVTIDDTNFLVQHPVGGGNILLTPRDPTYISLRKYLAEALPARAVVEAHVPILVEDGSASYLLPEPATPAQVVAELLRDIGLNATALPGASPEGIAQTEIRSGTASRDTPTREWLRGYLGGRSIPATGSSSGITVVLGSDFTSSAFPPPAPWPTPLPGRAPLCGA